MATDTNEKRNFAFRDEDGNESSIFSGKQPRQAALKAARRLPAASTEEEADRTTIRLRERGTDTIHVYDAWAWEEEAGEDAPEWVGDTVTNANVTKLKVEHTED